MMNLYLVYSNVQKYLVLTYLNGKEAIESVQSSVSKTLKNGEYLLDKTEFLCAVDGYFTEGEILKII